MARSQLDMVRTLVADGKSDEEVKQFFVERFGQWALLKPRAEPATALLWAGPVLLLVGGLAFVLWFSLRHRAPAVAADLESASPAASGDENPAPAVEEDPYLRRVRQELER